MIRLFGGLFWPSQANIGRLRIDSMRGFARSTQGISSVEFAIILPVLALFLFGIITFASALYIHVNMENAAREAARRMAVAEALGAGPPVSCPVAQADPNKYEAENYACIYLADWPIGFQIDTDCDDVNQEVTVSVQVSAEEVALADIFGFFDGRILTAKVTMRKEAATCV